jgi:hypothetical protein
MSVENDLRHLSQKMEEAGEAALKAGQAGLGLLLAEMEALRAVMPAAEEAEADRALREARERSHDAEVEADLDNLPV